jgi:hypothetical protein
LVVVIANYDNLEMVRAHDLDGVSKLEQLVEVTLVEDDR